MFPLVFVTLSVPFGLEISPAIVTPSAPVLVIVVSLFAAKFLRFAPFSMFVPMFEVITILPLALANPLPVSMLSVLTSDSNSVSAAALSVNTSVLPPTPAINSPPLPAVTLPPFNSIFSRARIFPLTVICPLPSATLDGSQVFVVGWAKEAPE